MAPHYKYSYSVIEACPVKLIKLFLPQEISKKINILKNKDQFKLMRTDTARFAMLCNTSFALHRCLKTAPSICHLCALHQSRKKTETTFL